MASNTYEVRITGDAKSLERALGKVDRSFGASAKSAALFAVKAAGIASVGVGITKVVTSAVDFDKSMRNVNSIAQVNEKQFRKLEDSVLALAGPTAQSPKVLAEGLYDLVSSGFDAKDSLKVLEASAKAATAGLTTTEESTKAVAAVLNAYKLPAAQAGAVSDALFRTVDRGVISFEELAANVGDALPFAASLGVNIKEVGAATATMTKQGIPAAETVTRIKNIMVALLKPSKGMKDAFEDLGVESGEALIKQKGLQGALEALVGTTDGTKASVAELFPEIRAMGGAFALTGENAKGAGEDLKGMRESAGATERALSEQSKSISYKWNQLKATFEAFGIKAGLAVKQFAEEVLSWNFNSKTSEAIAYAAAITGVALAIGAIGPAVLAAASALKALTLLAASNPLVALAVGAGVVVGALIALQGEEKKTAGAYRRSKQALESLGEASKRTKELRQKEKGAAGEVKAAENRLAQAREQFGARSQPALEAEVDLIAKRRRHKRINEDLAKSERVGGAERQAIMAILREDTAKLAKGVARLVSEKEEERFQLGNLTDRYKQGLVPLSKVREKQRELGETTKELNNGNRRLNELLLEAGRKIGPKFADKLADAAGKAANLARKGGEVNEWLKNLPAKTRMEIEVDIKVGGVNVGKGGTGDGWGVAGIKGAIRGKVEDYAKNNPGAFMQGSGALGNAPTGAGPAAVDMFTPYANKFGLSVTSGYRPGSITSSGNLSYHAMNRARDYADGPVAMMAFAKFMAANYGSKLRELIYTPLGFSIKDGAQVAPYAAAEHYDHVHVALAQGGLAATVPGSAPGDRHLLSLNGQPVARVESKEGIFVGNRTLMGALHAMNAAVPRGFSGGGVVGEIGSILMRHGLDKEAAAGIIGNAYGESGWNPAAIEPGTHNGGLWGFTASPVSLQDLKNYAASQNLPWTSVKAQTQFLVLNLGIHDSGYLNKLNSMGSVQETTESFLRDWENPLNESSMSKRIAAAQKALKMLGGISAGGGKGGGGGSGPKSIPAKADPKTGGMQAPSNAAKGPNTEPKRLPAGGGSVPNILQGIGMKRVEDIFKMPGLSPWRKSELALEAAESTKQGWDDTQVQKFQLNLGKTRKLKIQKEVARLNKRLSTERLTDKQRKQITARRNNLLGQVGTWNERIDTAREGLRGAGSEGIEAGEDPAVKAQEEATRAAEEMTAALKENAEQMKRQTDLAESAIATNSSTAWKALADIMSGTLGGSAQQSAALAGAGAVGSLGRF